MTTESQDILDTEFHPSTTRHVGILVRNGRIADVMSYKSLEETRDNLLDVIDNSFDNTVDDAGVFKIDANGNSEQAWVHPDMQTGD